MSDAFLGEIRIFAGNFPPYGWAFCSGQLMAISQNTALFSILGTQYGGDGKSTFALPNLNGAAPMNQGSGAGLSTYNVGELVGSDTVTLDTTSIPAHRHTVQAIASPENQPTPTNNYWAETPKGRSIPQEKIYDTTLNMQMSPNAISVAGSSQPHNNMQPYLAVNFIICLSGIFPSRS